MPRRTRLTLAVAVVLVAAVLGGWLWWRNAQPDPSIVRTGAYAVTLRGTGPDGTPFEARGELRIRPGADGLPYRWCLKVGLPAGDPKPGAIWFGSHGPCFGVGRAGAVVTWQVSDGENVLVPVNPPPAVTGSLNMFYATSVVMAEANLPDRGTVRFHAENDAVVGTIDLQGVAMGNDKRGAFAATLTASFISTDPDAAIA